MTKTTRALLWVFIGPAASIVAGYAAFGIFAFILGPGFDIDDRGTPIQKFFGAAALPSLIIIPVAGALISWSIAFAIYRQR